MEKKLNNKSLEKKIIQFIHYFIFYHLNQCLINEFIKKVGKAGQELF